MPNSERPRPVRRSTIENLEARQVMTADLLAGALEAPLMQHGFNDNIPDLVQHDAIPTMHQHDELPDLVNHGDQDADFFLDYETDSEPGDVVQHLDDAHSLTGLDDVRADYGFTGVGQTVVVIDSGIAFDHYALGGGFGADYRVVGGWDFTEDDANPYDDGPEGSHGTHVAGIIGGTGDLSGNDEGVAPGVDLIGLRVFDDAGFGTFTDVSNALQWVIDNHNAFENPITAVNLSLGTSWNSTTPPAWSSFLESRFQQIEALGIFISVSAGNSFTSYNTPGLSYPAASSYVVPVMSVDDNGSLSYFSQRHTSAIAAPGRGVRSTIPDYAGNNNGQADDWANFSGTSMAAPYVAGASVLVRQAMDLMGYTDITQDTIYDHMRATADSFFDSATSQNYLRLNLSAAIDSLLPDDDYGSTTGTAHDLGNLSSNAQVGGMISSLSDVDYFTFTAGANGVATFAVTDTHQLDVDWDFGGQSVTQTGSSWEMDVVAGQTYTVGVSTSDGMGYYDMDVSIESTLSYVDWSNIGGQQSHNSMANSGEQWYRFVADQAGYVTAQAAFAHAAGNIDIALYDASMQMVGQSAGTSDVERVDLLASAGDEFYLVVSGANSDIDFQLTNMVAISDTTVSVTGTAGDDVFAFAAGSSHLLTVNGVAYAFSTSTVNTISVDGGVGDDYLSITGSNDSETVRMYLATTTVTTGSFDFAATGIEDIVVDAGGGANDRVHLYDTGGDEVYTGWSDRSTFTGTGFSREVRGFDYVAAYSTAGNDTAVLHDTSGNDVYVAFDHRAVMYGADYYHDIRGFAATTAIATTGFDKAIFHDSAGDEVYTAESLRSVRTGDGFANEAIGFNYSLAYSGLGNDIAVLNDSNAYDILSVASADRAVMYSNGTYYNDLRDFTNITAYSTDGLDRVVYIGDSSDETFESWSDRSQFTTGGLQVDANGFYYNAAFSNGGNDEAVMNDSSGDDSYVAFHNRAVLYSAGYFSDAYGFAVTRAYSTTGTDEAVFYDSSGDDTFTSYGHMAQLVGTGFHNEAHGFGKTTAYSSTGDDHAYFFDTADNDVFVGWSNRAVMYGTGYFNDARGFNRVEAQASSGNDLAVLHTSSSLQEELHAETWGAYVQAADYRNQVQGFDAVNAFDQDGDGGNDLAFNNALDYIFNLYGDWS